MYVDILYVMYMYVGTLYRSSWEKPVMFTTLIIMCSLHPIVLAVAWIHIHLYVHVHVHVNVNVHAQQQ